MGIWNIWYELFGARWTFRGQTNQETPAQSGVFLWALWRLSLWFI